MKYLFLFLLAASAAAQTVVTVSPPLSTTEIDSIIVDSTSTTIRSVTKPFSGITAGMLIQSPRIPKGTKVVSNTNDSILVISAYPYNTVALDSMRFAKYTATQAYSIGDAMGFAMLVGDFRKIYSILIEDDIKVADSVDVVFFRDSTFTETEDNLAFAPSDTDAKKIVGYVPFTTWYVFSNNHLITMSPTAQPISLATYGSYRGKLWMQLIARGASTFTAVDAVKVTIIGE